MRLLPDEQLRLTINCSWKWLRHRLDSQPGSAARLPNEDSRLLVVRPIGSLLSGSIAPWCIRASTRT